MTERTPQQEATYLEKLGFAGAKDNSAVAEKAAQAFYAEFQDVMKTHSTQYLDQMGQSLKNAKATDGVGIGVDFGGSTTLHFQDVSFWGGKDDSPTGPRVIDGDNPGRRDLPQVRAGQTVHLREGSYVAEKGSHVIGTAQATELEVFAESGSVVDLNGSGRVDAFKGSSTSVKNFGEASAFDGSKVTVGDRGFAYANAGSHVTAEKGGMVVAEAGSYIDAEAGSEVLVQKGAHIKIEKGAVVKWA
jgi:hypothetical protein